MDFIYLQHLPYEFCFEFGNQIPNYVYLGFTNGDTWGGVYKANKSTIENLSQMMDFYGIKPYYVFMLEYNGGGNFRTQIFDHNAVEICYPLKRVLLKKPRVIEETFSSIELDKMAAKFFYNASSDSRDSYDLFIKKEHLQQKTVIQVNSYL